MAKNSKTRLTQIEPNVLWIAADETGVFMLFAGEKPTRVKKPDSWGGWEGRLLDMFGIEKLSKYTDKVPHWEDEPIMIQICA